MSGSKTKKLFDILPVGLGAKILGSTDIDIEGISIDSRSITKGCIYAAFVGTLTDGHNYISSAIEHGATCIICTHVEDLVEGVTYIMADDARTYTGVLAHSFFDMASLELRLVGVTGTNGKTTVCTLLFQLFTQLGYKCGLISTVENKIGHQVIPATHTTPDVVRLHQLLAEMRDQHCEYVFMEVSSHAVDQKRIAGLSFEGALFTNITHDHLDYHGTMLNYINAKKQFFDVLPKSAFALVNTDDKNGNVMVQNTLAQIKTYGLRSVADFKVKILENSLEGLHLKINDIETHFRMIGEFNAYNLAAVFGSAVCLGEDQHTVLAVLSGLKGAEGRFEQVIDRNTGKCGIVDYAHTPDALDNVLETITKAKDTKSRIITIVGCGGDRDAGKRPMMAQIACRWSDQVILTSDNPRTEDPDVIIDAMESGLCDQDRKKTIRMTDRYQAIKTGVMMANGGDIVLVAGKGHENYQEIQGKKFPFDDKKILEDLFG
ncbi:MAG: UDP-N-acetylmuramoyl-L-alanyl-D-glutamate--2,6-diaminopimelate ligase [Saprospiraceae bacterium]